MAKKRMSAIVQGQFKVKVGRFNQHERPRGEFLLLLSQDRIFVVFNELSVVTVPRYSMTG